MLKKFALILIMLLAVGLASGCTNEPSARRTLEAAGYNNISFTGYDFFSCSDQDFYATGFTAVGHNGQRVKGVVCEGFLFKGATIRMH